MKLWSQTNPHRSHPLAEITGLSDCVSRDLDDTHIGRTLGLFVRQQNDPYFGPTLHCFRALEPL